MKTESPLRALPGVLLATALGLLPGLAHARSTSVLSYPTEEVWPAAVRFLRIDRDCPVLEKDEAAGYILFDFVDGKKTHKGSIELIRTTDADGRVATRTVISIPDLPRHYEQLLLDKLAAKMREERGFPAPRPQHKPEGENKAAPDAGSR